MESNSQGTNSKACGHENIVHEKEIFVFTFILFDRKHKAAPEINRKIKTKEINKWRSTNDLKQTDLESNASCVSWLIILDSQHYNLLNVLSGS